MTAVGTVGRAVRVTGVLLMLSTVQSSPPADAQEVSAFGGYEVVATGAGFTAAPTVPAVLPVETPVEGTLALALASLSTGGLGYGLASSVYPGTPIVGLRPLLEAGAGVALPIPDYPVVVESREYDEAKTSRLPGITMSSDVDPGRSTVSSDLGGFTFPGIVDVGSVRTTSESVAEQARVAATVTTEVTGIDLLDGSLHIDDIKTWASAETDGATATCDGGVTVSGATAGGRDVEIDESGLHASGATAIPLVGPDDTLESLLASTGVQIRTLGGNDACAGSTADRTTSGVLVSVPLPAAGPVPPGGRLDIVLGSVSARALVTAAFTADIAPHRHQVGPPPLPMSSSACRNPLPSVLAISRSPDLRRRRLRPTRSRPSPASRPGPSPPPTPSAASPPGWPSASCCWRFPAAAGSAAIWNG